MLELKGVSDLQARLTQMFTAQIACGFRVFSSLFIQKHDLENDSGINCVNVAEIWQSNNTGEKRRKWKGG